jgi:hypothetical protein
MSHPPPDLPAAPPQFHRFGWHGIALILPEAWNLRLHEGDARAGALVFADLRQHRMEVRWKSSTRFGWRYRKPHALLDRTLERLHKRHTALDVSHLSPDVVRIALPEGTLLLAADRRRLYELHWPEASSASGSVVNTITDDFLTSLPVIAGRAERYWSVYGAAGWIESGLQLKKASLLPGATRLEFAGHGRAATLGAFSMADRLLKNGTPLRIWAASQIPVIARYPAGTWQESPNAATFTAAARRRFRPMTHAVNLHHDTARNLIRWTHRFGPAERSK